MLEELLDSPEGTVLGFLLVAPPRAFSELELSKRLGMPHVLFTGTLAKLLQHGYIRQFSKRGIKYFILSQKHTLFPEIRTALLKERVGYEDELFTAVQKLKGIEAAFLSGLFVGRTELPVDLLIVGNLSTEKFREFLENCERMMQQELNYSIMEVGEFLERKGTFDRFIKDIFDYPHVVVVDKIKKQ